MSAPLAPALALAGGAAPSATLPSQTHAIFKKNLDNAGAERHESPSRRHAPPTMMRGSPTRDDSPSKKFSWDLGEPPKGSNLTRAVTPTPSQTPSVGLLEVQGHKGTEMFLKEMHTFMAEMQHMTPTMRFEMTQKALLDMQEMVNVHKAMRDKSERNAAVNKKACLDAEAECSRLRIENGRMEKSLHLREQNLLKERATNKKLSADLEAKTQESFEHAQEAHYLSRQLKYSQEDCASKADTIAKLESKNEHLNDELTQSQAHVRRLEKQVANAQNQGIETEKKLTATQRELKATAAAEKAAWDATQKTRSSIIDGIDEALLMNPNHFNEVDMMAHGNRGVVLAGVKGVK